MEFFFFFPDEVLKKTISTSTTNFFVSLSSPPHPPLQLPLPREQRKNAQNRLGHLFNQIKWF